MRMTYQRASSVDHDQMVTVVQASGISHDDQEVTVVLTKTRRGWARRSATRGWDRENVSRENMNDLKAWFAVDFKQHRGDCDGDGPGAAEMAAFF